MQTSWVVEPSAKVIEPPITQPLPTLTMMQFCEIFQSIVENRVEKTDSPTTAVMVPV